MKVYELRIVNEAGEVSVSQHRSYSGAMDSMLSNAFNDLSAHLDVSSDRQEEVDYISQFLDSVKDEISKNDSFPHDSLPGIFVNKVSAVTGISYGIIEKEVF